MDKDLAAGRVSPGGRLRRGLALLALPCLSLGCWLPPPLMLTREEPAVVEYTGGQCRWFLARPLNWPSHYILMEWTWGDRPVKGDLLVGVVQPLETATFTTADDREMEIYVEAYELDHIRALDLFRERCKYDGSP